MDSVKIGQNLKELRIALGFNQEQVADFMGIKREMISYYETGTRLIPPPVLMKAADLYGVELTDLLEEDVKQSKLNAALAFRAENIEDSDLEVIASFKRIAKNYIRMKDKLAENE